MLARATAQEMLCGEQRERGMRSISRLLSYISKESMKYTFYGKNEKTEENKRNKEKIREYSVLFDFLTVAKTM
ncbi:MAG: hypothetical protein NC409_00070 [Clostridium sp.]|nr:hypothetical protein [Clostridium sp.]